MTNCKPLNCTCDKQPHVQHECHVRYMHNNYRAVYLINMTIVILLQIRHVLTMHMTEIIVLTFCVDTQV